MLTEEQQKIAEQAFPLIRPVYVAFYRRMPCLREMMKVADLTGAAHLAICAAAKTYDPSRGVGLSAYFSVAIKNAFLREIERELKTQAHSIRRIPLELADAHMPPSNPTPEVAVSALLKLPEEDRKWIESYVFRDGSFRALGREFGVDNRAAKRKIRSKLDRLRDAIDDEPQ